jgi:hypothetical protein
MIKIGRKYQNNFIFKENKKFSGRQNSVGSIGALS